MRLQAGVASDRGLVRPVNEDSFFLREGLYAVCDGMGGARGGEVASQMACLGLLGLNPATAGQQGLREAITAVNRTIAQRSAGDHHLMGMGTTLTAVLLHEGHLTLAHVGDSRAYLLHQGDLRQLSEDHSWVGEMVRRGDLTPAQAAVHPHRSVITRALGTEEDIEADLTDIPVVEGDRILICSDGLTGMVPDTDLVELLEQGQGPQATAELLVKTALANGGEDNVTVVVIDVLADSAEKNAKPEESGPFSGQVLFGPSDRGTVLASSINRAGRAVGGVRERLSRRTLPSLRPVAGRGAAEQGRAGAAVAEAPPAPASPAGAPVAEAAAGGSVPREGPVTAAADVDAALEDPATSGQSEPAPAPGVAPETVSDEEMAVELAPLPAAKIAAKRAPRGKRSKWIFFALAGLLVIVIIVIAFGVYNSSVYYVGTAADGTLALYRGLPHSVLGIELSQLIQLGTVKYDALTPQEQQQVDSHDLVSKEDGQMLLQSLVPQL